MIVPEPQARPPKGPAPTPSPLDIPVSTNQRRCLSIASLVYLLATLVGGVWYVLLLAPIFSNDFYWSHYNVSGYQVFLIDLVNVKLQTMIRSSAVDLLSVDSVSTKNYATDLVQSDFSPHFARRVFFSEMNTIRQGVAAMRATSVLYAPFVNAQYCWVDFAQRWDIAHTVARSTRCRARYSTNAAIYLETLVRNFNWNAFVQLNAVPWFTVIGNALLATRDGTQWMTDRPLDSLRLTLDDEVQYLKHAVNLTQYVLYYDNAIEMGVTDTVQVENAVGLVQTVPLKAMPIARGPWTTKALFWGFSNDLTSLVKRNASLVRGSTNYFANVTGLSDYAATYGFLNARGQYVNQIAVFYGTIGPFGSVDSFYVAPPVALVTLYTDLKLHLYTHLESDTQTQTTFQGMLNVAWTPIPPNFARPNLSYFGGNVLCMYNPSTPYPQSQFDIYDDCTNTRPFTVAGTRQTLLFALAVAGATHPASICAFQGDIACVATLLRAQAVLNASGLSASLALINQTLNDMPSIHFVQYVVDVNAKSWRFLRQPLLTANRHWSFYGLLAIFDWVQGTREVVRLEGDVSTLILMSEASPSIHLLAESYHSNGVQGNELIWYLVVYTSFVSVFVGLVVLGYWLPAFDLISTGRRLFRFNRVVGSVWIGRPLLLIRGCTALVALSTLQVSLVCDHGVSRLQFTSRPVVATALVAGEATWVAYVINDVLTVLVGRFNDAAPLASLAAWFATCLWSLEELMLPTATLDRQCTSQYVNYAITCTSGLIHVGDKTRVFWLLVVQLAAIVLGHVAAWVVQPHPVKLTHVSLLLHGIAVESYYDSHYPRIDHLDDPSCVMTGLLPFTFRGTSYTLDVKLWALFNHGRDDNSSLRRCDRTTTYLKNPRFGTSTTALPNGDDDPQPRPPSPTTVTTTVTRGRATAILAMGLGYIVFSILGSFSYIAVSTVNFANDFYWATFNLTGHHVAMADWINEQVVSSRNLIQFRFDERRWSTSSRNFTDLSEPIYVSPMLAPRLQFESLNSISVAIQGIRHTDPCAVPWIFTQYCWVDFQRQWPMANSNVRQNRCLASNEANGAVYLESVLRNTDWNAFTTCWGRAFELAIGHELNQSLAGQHWLAQVSSMNANSINDEAIHWTTSGIQHYVVQWQNYKTMGLVNTYLIENAFGVQYPMTLSHSNGSYRMSSQTSFKMYWGWGNDLWAIDQNATLLSGKSLLRSSANFAFANTSMLPSLVQAATLTLPLAAAYELVQHQIGPFGSIDMKNVPCPRSAKSFVASALDVIRSSIGQTARAAARFGQLSTGAASLSPFPRTWPKTMLQWISRGGSILCHEFGSTNLGFGYTMWTGRLASCNQASMSILRPTAEVLVMAAMAANLTNSITVGMACSCLPSGSNACSQTYLNQSVAFVSQYIADDVLQPLQQMATTASTDVWRQQVSLMQYLQPNASQPLQRVHFELFDPVDPTFNVWSWLFVLEWAKGTREVVSFQGDVGSLNVITTIDDWDTTAVQPHELPTTFSVYARSGLQYVTGVLLGVAGLFLVYVGATHGHVEGANMFALNRVAGIVWVGRPLLFLRGITALALLSTATLEMQLEHGVSSFTVPIVPWYKTILSAGEATWLVYVLNDICMVWTEHWTSQYASPSSVLVWIVAAILTLARPVVHSVTIDPVCTIDQMDFQLVCISGTVYIGQKERFYWLLGIIGLCNGGVYTAIRLTKRHLKRDQAESLLLTSGAKYMFKTRGWMHQQTYFMDPASALLNGLVTLRWHNVIVVMDVKLWRIFSIELNRATLPKHIQSALPLTD
ncbi:Aste57867_1786 [Aphanomyces stellatus]|uniref:Aste57867_1786 protein n=1 Tax=Aphanomyces stellatus TaxID=120398 RepID=A0A485K788_9STRA|nr:hypothetical protein As57867_001784 [Aphanomyces stellatus]VFT78995.1 Aste57867_1786 [Aphanomyces stellatus]